MSMYNEKQKLEYIDHEGINEKVLTNRFKQIGKYEKRYEKDLCEMNADELKGIFTALNILTPQTRLNVKSLMNSYIEWCIHTKKTSKENSLKMISVEDIASPNAIETKMLKSPEQVANILKEAFSDEENYYQNRTIMYKLLFWLFYSGLSEEEIQKLKKDSLDYESKTIKGSAKENLVVFDEVVPLWKKFIDIDEIEFTDTKKRTNYSNKLVESDYLFRRFKIKESVHDYVQEYVFRSHLRKIFLKYQEKTGWYLLVSITNMIMSGYFYKLYISGKTDEDIRKEISDLYGGINKNSGKFYSVFNNYKEWRNFFYE